MVTKREDAVEPPPYQPDDGWVDERGIRWTIFDDVPSLSTWELAKELNMYHETVYRWAKKWFGPLPPHRRGGANIGYRIPLEYRGVARVWADTQDPRIREVARRAHITAPRNFVVVVANVGSTHYSAREAVERMESLASTPTYKGQVISLINVGD